MRKRERRFCVQCGEPYIWLASHPREYCSKKCENIANGIIEADIKKKIQPKMKKTSYTRCAYCGMEMDIDSSQGKKHCSKLCQFLDDGKNQNIKKETRECLNCGKKFICPVISERKYCSQKCENIAKGIEDVDIKEKIKPRKNNTSHKKCKYCGIEFDVDTPRSRKYCTQLCRSLDDGEKQNIKKETRKCLRCGKEFTCPIMAERKYCSEQCEKEQLEAIINSRKDLENTKKKEDKRIGERYYKKTELRVCKNCGKEFTWFPAKATGYYCSKECKEEALQERKIKEAQFENPTEKILYEQVEAIVKFLVSQVFLSGNSFNDRSIDYWKVGNISENTREEVLARDDFECQISHRKDNLHIHHIIKRRNGGDHTPDNLITLCASCHRHIETGDEAHAVNRCFENAKNYCNTKENRAGTYVCSVKEDIEIIFSELEQMKVEEFQNILIELDDILEKL